MKISLILQLFDEVIVIHSCTKFMVLCMQVGYLCLMKGLITCVNFINQLGIYIVIANYAVLLVFY